MEIFNWSKNYFLSVSFLLHIRMNLNEFHKNIYSPSKAFALLIFIPYTIKWSKPNLNYVLKIFK